MTTLTFQVFRRIVPAVAAAAVLWAAAPAVGFELAGGVTPHEPSWMLLFGGALFGCAAAVRRKSSTR